MRRPVSRCRAFAIELQLPLEDDGWFAFLHIYKRVAFTVTGLLLRLDGLHINKGPEDSRYTPRSKYKRMYVMLSKFTSSGKLQLMNHN